MVQPKRWFKKKFSSLYLKILYFYIPAVLLHNVLIKIGWYSLESTDPVINTYSMIDFAKQTVLAICLGGREPIVGAMWFVYVLFMALIGLSVVSWAIKKLVKDERQYEWMRGIALLAMCIVAGILSNKYGLTIRRFSNTFTAMLLIYVGKIMYQKMKLSFDNGYLAIVCGLVAFEVACMLGGVSLNGNEYKDILQLLVAAPAVLYIIMYIGKHIETNVVGKAIAYVGKESFYVMALHFVGFKFCTLALHSIGTVVKRLKLYNRLIVNVIENSYLCISKKNTSNRPRKAEFGGIAKINLHGKGTKFLRNITGSSVHRV